MTQPSKKDNHGDCIDRITKLPRNLIDCILEHLTVRDQVRTSILSKKWKCVWFSVPRIEFDEGFYNLFDNLDDPASEISRLITDILFHHNGPINKFILNFPCNHKITFQYLKKWILFLSRKDVQHIYLNNIEEKPVPTPFHLFSCQGLTYLKLNYFNMSVPPNFCGFKRLLCLHLKLMIFESGALESLLSGCPLLQELSIEYCSGCESIIDLSFSALTDLKVAIAVNCKFRFNKSLPMLQRLTVELVCEMLYQYADIFPLSQLINLKHLSLEDVHLDEREEFLYIVSVLKSATNLVKFDIVTYYARGCEKRAPDLSEELESSCCCLSELQEVNIVVRKCNNHAMSLARFILANSSSLKTLTVKLPIFDIQSDELILSSTFQDLLMMERASQKAIVKLIHQSIDIQL